MSDIDFLAKQKGADQESKSQDNKKEKIVWSEPDENKPLVKETAFRWLSSLTKKKVINRPAQAPPPEIDKNKIRQSRREILKLIKHNKTLEPREKTRPSQGWLASLIAKFKKRPSHKEVLIDYQQVFKQRKVAKDLPIEQTKPTADKLSAAKFIQLPHPPQASSFVEPPLAKDRGEPKVAAIKTEPLKQKEIKLEIPRPAPARPTYQTEISLKTTSAEKPVIKDKPWPLEETVGIKSDHSEVLETNLIKGEIITFFDWHKKIITLINAILIPVFLVAAIYLGLMYYQQVNQSKIEEQYKRFAGLNTEIKQAEIGLGEIIDFQAKLKIVTQIFAQHIYWTNLFKFFEDKTIKDVYYTGFSGDTSGNYSPEAIAKRYSNISEQVNILRENEKITEVRTAGGEAISADENSEDSIRFNLDISILNSIFTE